MFNLYLSVEQEQRKRQAFNARDVEADKNCDFEKLGRADFNSGAEPRPELVLEYSYRVGYQGAMWQYYYKKYEVKEIVEF